MHPSFSYGVIENEDVRSYSTNRLSHGGLRAEPGLSRTLHGDQSAALFWEPYAETLHGIEKSTVNSPCASRAHAGAKGGQTHVYMRIRGGDPIPWPRAGIMSRIVDVGYGDRLEASSTRNFFFMGRRERLNRVCAENEGLLK